MHIKTHRLNGSNLLQLHTQLEQLAQNAPAQLAICFGNYRSIQLVANAGKLSGVAEQWLAGSSCQGCADEQGLNNSSDYAASVLLINDPNGAFGVASADLSNDPATQATMALAQAMLNAGKPHELPKLIWCMQAPGQEELVLESFKTVVGDTVPIYGGSAADDSVSGDWLQFDGKTLYQNGLIVAVFYPSTGLSSFFSCGYSEVRSLGTVTQVQGRELLTLDQQPAAERYRDAVAAISTQELLTGNVLKESTFYPIGRKVNHADFPLYLLSHPAFITEHHSLQMFSEVYLGETLYLMQGDRNQLINRAADVCSTALKSLKFKYDGPAAGALVVFCGGCMLAIKSDLHLVQSAIKQALGDIPFLITFTFGEQGSFLDGSNRHGNLMISAVIFGA